MVVWFIYPAEYCNELLLNVCYDMGCNGFNFSGSSFDEVKDPSNYEILDNKLVGKYLGCVNYGVSGCSLSMLKTQKLIDLHFSDNSKSHSAIARFEPTKLCYNMAYRLAVYYTGIDNV